MLRALIVNLRHDNVSITGSRTIDFNGRAFFDPDRFDVPPSRVPFTGAQVRECTHPIGPRPSLCLFMHGAKNLTVRGIRLIDAPCWTLTFSECENVTLTGLSIDTDLNIPNDDGIHISACRGVIISDCHISSGDDCIALSAITNWERPCEDVVIPNCVLRSCSKAIVVGYMYSVLITNCIIRDVKLRDVAIARKPLANIALKGHAFDLAPGRETVEAPADCALRIVNADVTLEGLNTGGLRILS